MITINEGTQTPILSVENAGTAIPYVKLDAGVGTNISDWGGTIPTVANLTSGSVRITVGTITTVTNIVGGTVQLNPVPVPTTLTLGTLGTAGGSFFATISAASGAGTKHYISGVQVVGQSGTADVRILAGTAIQGTGVIAAGIVVPGGGYARDFNKDFQTGTNSELIYHFVGAGTAFITVNYWKGT